MESRERETRDRLHALESQNHNLNNAVQEKETVVIQNKKEAEDLTHQVLQLSERSLSELHWSFHRFHLWI